MSNRLQVDDREARRILRQRQKKTRTRTSCYPCQTRKVRCNKEQPCKNCAQRGYPELCTFSSPELGGMNIEATPIEIDHHTTMHDNATVNGRTLESNNPIDTHPQENDDASHFDNEMASPNSINPPVQYHQTSDNNEVGKPANNASRNTHYLGQNSIPNFIREQSGSGLVPKERTPIGSIEDAIMPMLGLQESASSYPFLISPSDANDPSLALPNSRELIRCFECYRTHVHLYTPLLCDVIEFEQDLCRYIAGRSDSATSSEQPRSGNAIAWLGLLFAVVASGTQFSDADVSTRGPKSRTFVRIAFHCLRLANFLTRPSITCLQALLIIGNVLQNNSEPEGAWMLLGTTARMGQSLGLHDNLQKRSQQVSTSTGYLLWEAVICQDTLLSLCFDRPPLNTNPGTYLPNQTQLSYAEAMTLLSYKTIPIISKSAEDINFENLLSHVNMIEDIELYVQEHLKSIVACNSISQRCEYFAFRLHLAFIIAWLCRPALRPRVVAAQEGHKTSLAKKCKEQLVHSVEAFVQLHTSSIVVTRSWAVIHNGLSSALLLGLIGATKTDPKIRQLQAQIVEIFSSDTEKGGELLRNVDADTGLSRGHVRAFNVLRSLLSEQDVSSPKSFRQGPEAIENEANHENRLENQTVDLAYQNVPSQLLSDPLISGDRIDSGIDVSALDTFDSIFWDPSYTTQDYLQEPWVI